MGKGDPKPGGKKDKRLKENRTSTKMPLTRKQMNAQHARMTGTRKK